MVKKMIILAVLLLSFSTTALAQKTKEKKPPPTGERVLWREPTDIESRDLFLGPGGAAMKPDLSRVTFLKDQAGGGFSINYRVLMNNWDLKDDNNRILYVPKGASGGPELQYILSDLGATFGKTGGFIGRSRNKPEDYAKAKFVEGVEGGRVKFAYGGKNSGLFDSVTVEQAKWIGTWLARLSDKQLSDAFRAANYTPEEVQVLTNATRARINQLTSLQ